MKPKIEGSKKPAVSHWESYPGAPSYIGDCKSWWLSGSHNSVAEDWRLNPGVLLCFPLTAGFSLASIFASYIKNTSFQLRKNCPNQIHL